MMSIKKSMKVTLLTAALATVMGLTACEKQTEEAPEQEAEQEVPMSAEPAENNEPVIVADDLDEVDAQSQYTEAEGDSTVDPSTAAVDSSGNSQALESTTATTEAESVTTTDNESQATEQ